MEKVLKTQLVTHGTDVPGSRLKDVPLFLLYFGACWSVPCKDLTPYLVLAYNAINRDGKVLEIIYVSQDPTEHQFRESFREMPWLGINRRHSDIIEELRNLYRVDSVPQLVLVDSKGLALKRDCMNDVVQQGARWLRPYLNR
jgi:thiol-disulfide isomerase/thioredoxin